jgi:hypothetical protein
MNRSDSKFISDSSLARAVDLGYGTSYRDPGIG